MLPSLFPAPKQTHLTQAGFMPLPTEGGGAPHQPTAYIPASEIRYEHACQAQDGTRLYVYSWLNAPGYLLTTEPRLTTERHIIAELDTDDHAALQQAVADFFAAHGGAARPFPPGVN